MKTQEWLVCTYFTEKNSVLSFMFSQTQIIIGEKAERRSRNFLFYPKTNFIFVRKFTKKHPEKTRANGLCIQVFQNIFIIPLSGSERIILNGYYINFFEGFCNARFIYKKSYTMNMFFDTMGYKMEEKSVQKFQNWFKKISVGIDKKKDIFVFVYYVCNKYI